MKYKSRKLKKLLMPAAAVLSGTIVFSSVTVPALAQEPTEVVSTDAAQPEDTDGTAAENAVDNGADQATENVTEQSSDANGETAGNEESAAEQAVEDTGSSDDAGTADAANEEAADDITPPFCR